MSLLLPLRRLYAPETLDLRFVYSSTTPTPDSARSRAGPNKKDGYTNPVPGTKPPLWKTPEYAVYIVFVVAAVTSMCNCIYQISKPSHPNYKNFERLLSPGWMFGRKVDNSDTQYATFRANVPYLLVLTVAHPLLRNVYNLAFPVENTSKGTGELAKRAADARLRQRLGFDLPFSLAFVFVLHGFSGFKVLFILLINYCIATKLPKRLVVPTTWAFNIGILFANELYAGYRYRLIAGAIVPRHWRVIAIGTVMDLYGGLIPRWDVLFNITVLRLISFNMDYYWSLDKPASSILEVRLSFLDDEFTFINEHKKKQLDMSNLSERDRVDIPAKPDEYGLRNYLCYILYAPLYLTGPIITFNDYVSQLRYKPKGLKFSRTLLYAFRFLICLLMMEFMLHFQYAVAISKAKPAWEVYSPFQLSMLGYFNLHIIWLKLLLPWRCARAWALFDGIDPPENMVRCMSDNYSALAFWRGWHRSFNRWIVRYIYIPLGGSGKGSKRSKFDTLRVSANYIAVFTFVALWHDINLRLLIWGWMIVLFILPEVLATLAFPAKKWQNRPVQYRLLCGLGATGNIMMMMAANLVGFAIGLDGLKGVLQGILGSFSGLIYLLAACTALFMASQIMFEVREEERRHGIKLPC